VAGTVILGLLAAGVMVADDLVRATSACFVTVYLLSLAAATRFLAGQARTVAAVAFVLVAIVTVFSAAFLAVPAVVAAVTLLARRRRSAILLGTT
jgi:amino acid efflux transporter